MDSAATCVGHLLARGGLFCIDAARRMEMSRQRSDTEMIGVFAALFLFWVAVAGLAYFLA